MLNKEFKNFDLEKSFTQNDVTKAKSEYQAVKQNATRGKAELTTSSSTEGGWNPAYNRLKLTGISEIEEMLGLENPFSHAAIPENTKEGDLRVCFRLVADSKTIEQIQDLAAKKGLIFEYRYADGNNSGNFVLGMGINGSDRNDENIIIKDGKTTISEQKTGVLEVYKENIKQRRDRARQTNPMNILASEVDLSILTTIEQLNQVQKHQLATELIKHFGAGWSIEEVNKIDKNKDLQPIIFFDKMGNLASFIIAEKNGNCVELTEMFSVKKGAGSELIPKILHVCRQFNDWKDLTYYAECNLANSAWLLACGANGELKGFIPKNVSVKSHHDSKSELTSFAVITF